MLKKIVLGIAVVLAGLIVGEAQITVPHSFTTSVPVTQLNTNLSTIGSGALNRAGGTITGNILVNNGVTIDGVDIGAELDTTGDLDIDTLILYGTGAGVLDVAGGINAGSANVGIVDSSGKIPAISSTYFASLSGANLTNISATTLANTTMTARVFAAGDFTGNVPMTWTVDAGDVNTNTSVRIGNLLIWTFLVTSTDIGGTATGELRLSTPSTAVFATTCTGSYSYIDAGTAGAGYFVAPVGGAYVSLHKNMLGTLWTLTTGDNTEVAATIICEVS